jgi:hypothetical protein
VLQLYSQWEKIIYKFTSQTGQVERLTPRAGFNSDADTEQQVSTDELNVHQFFSSPFPASPDLRARWGHLLGSADITLEECLRLGLVNLIPVEGFQNSSQGAVSPTGTFESMSTSRDVIHSNEGAGITGRYHASPYSDLTKEELMSCIVFSSHGLKDGSSYNPTIIAPMPTAHPPTNDGVGREPIHPQQGANSGDQFSFFHQSVPHTMIQDPLFYEPPSHIHSHEAPNFSVKSLAFPNGVHGGINSPAPSMFPSSYSSTSTSGDISTKSAGNSKKANGKDGKMRRLRRLPSVRLLTKVEF